MRHEGLVAHRLPGSLVASKTPPGVARQAARAQNLMARRESLVTPMMAAWVLRAAGRSSALGRSTSIERPGALSGDEQLGA